MKKALTLLTVVLLASISCYAVSLVARDRFLNRTTEILPTTIFTPTKDGEYRISLYITTPPNPTTGLVCLLANWTDEFGNNTPFSLNTIGPAQALAFYGPSGAGVTGRATGTAFARVKANTPITIRVPVDTNCSIPANGYSAVVTVEHVN